VSYTITPRRLAANRENAQHSTGPRTESGKLRASRNSLHHHAFSAHLCHPGEDEHNFHLLRNAILADLAPQSILELCLADRVVSAAWRLRRLQHADQYLTKMQQTDWRASVEAYNEKLEDRRERFLDNCKRHDLHRNPDGAEADDETLFRDADIPEPLPVPAEDATSDDDPPMPAPGFFLAQALSPDAKFADPDTRPSSAARTTRFERLLTAELRLQGMMARALRDLRQLRLDRRDPEKAPEEFTPFATLDQDVWQDDDHDNRGTNDDDPRKAPTTDTPPPPPPKGATRTDHATSIAAAGEGRGEGPFSPSSSSSSSSKSPISNSRSPSPLPHSVPSVSSVVNPLLQNERICQNDSSPTSILARAATLAPRSHHPRRTDHRHP
jgi:hypothetical protein